MSQENQRKAIDRRAVVNAAAWTVPVIAFGATAPFASASCQGGGAFTAPLPQSGDVGPAGTRVTFTVPRGITWITFDVVGGAGGGSSNRPYAAGRRVQGAVTVTPGEVLTFVTGQGGYYDGNSYSTGGQGYGNGGDVPIPSGNLTGFLIGGSGGGGSAILRGSTPLVVAGGGAGRGHHLGRIVEPDPSFSGDGSTETENATRQGASQRFVEAGHGLPASGATAGAGGAYWSQEGSVIVGSGVVVGNGGGSAAGGANGGNGVSTTVQRTGSLPTGAYGTASGGGGGGYRGGGSGAAVRISWDAAGTFSGAMMAIAGAGGNGSSFAATSTSNVVHSTGGNANGGTANRAPGLVRVTWSC